MLWTKWQEDVWSILESSGGRNLWNRDSRLALWLDRHEETSTYLRWGAHNTHEYHRIPTWCESVSFIGAPCRWGVTTAIEITWRQVHHQKVTSMWVTVIKAGDLEHNLQVTQQMRVSFPGKSCSEPLLDSSSALCFFQESWLVWEHHSAALTDYVLLRDLVNLLSIKTSWSFWFIYSLSLPVGWDVSPPIGTSFFILRILLLRWSLKSFFP